MIRRAALTAAAVLVCSAWAAAQISIPSEAFLNRQRMIEEEVREALNRELPVEQRIDFDYGGWYSFHLMLFDDGIRNRTYRHHDLRLWASASLDQGAHQFYGRLKLQFQDFNSGDGYRRDDDWVGPNLDRGFYQFDLRRALRAYRGEHLDWNLRVKVGRDLVEFGTGYALSTPLDHVLLTAELGKLEIVGLGGTTIRSEPDIDRSHPRGGRSQRNFWGTQVAYTGLERHRPFFFAFWNRDQRSSPPYRLLQRFGYDTHYLGLGSTGELIRNLRYGTELVYEGGQSYGDRRLRRDDVKAWAYNLDLEYLSQRPMKPRFGGEYMYASGDPDRRFSPTNAIGGNRRGNDTSFVGFGWRDTGLAFLPRLSNIHIWRLGGAFVPLENVEALKNLELGTNWYLYCKDRQRGAISDPTADRTSSYLGWEMDYFVNWRITSDVAWTARLGTFFPGSAFSDRGPRTAFLTGVTWSF